MPDLNGNTKDETIQNLRDWISSSLKKVEERILRRAKKAKAKRKDDVEEEGSPWPPLVLSWTDPDGQEKIVVEFDRDAVEDMGGSGGTMTIAEKLYDAASRDAEALGDKQTYFVTVEHAPGRFPMVFREAEPAGDPFDDDSPGEPDDEDDEEEERGGFGGGPGGFGSSRRGGMHRRGPEEVPEIVQFMKLMVSHQQFLVHENRIERQDLNRLTSRTIQELSETVQSFHKEQARGMSVYEDLIQARHARDLETKKALLGEERKERAFQMLEPFGRAMAVKLMGPPAMAGDGSQTMAKLFESVFSTLTPDQFQKLQTVLSPEQIQHITELFMTIQNLEEQKKAESEKAAAARAGANGHAYGNGAAAGGHGLNGTSGGAGSGSARSVSNEMHQETESGVAAKQ